MSYCDKSCRPCMYSTYLSTWGICCNYILVTGNRRGCPAGKECERRIEGTKARTLDEMLFRGQEEKKKPPKTAAEAVEMARRAEERKQRKAAWRKAWRAKNRERLNEYQNELRRKKRAGTQAPPPAAPEPHSGREGPRGGAGSPTASRSPLPEGARTGDAGTRLLQPPGGGQDGERTGCCLPEGDRKGVTA